MALKAHKKKKKSRFPISFPQEITENSKNKLKKVENKRKEQSSVSYPKILPGHTAIVKTFLLAELDHELLS